MAGKLLLLLLLLLAEMMFLAKCQQTPQVLISPNLRQVYAGDFFYIKCLSSSNQGVKWFFRNQEQPGQTSEIWKIAAAHPKHSGSYHCAVNSVHSGKVDIQVLGFFPRASLRMDTGQPVMRPGSIVSLQLENEDGLQGWLCWVHKGERTKRIKLRLSNNTVRLLFSSNTLVERENIYWCTDKERQQRSNQIIVLTSDKAVSLEMDPFPALAGDSVTMTCLVWGTDQISHAGFYVNASDLQTRGTSTYQIPHVTTSEKGSYKCNAYFYTDSSKGPLHEEASDAQDLEVYEIQMRAKISEVRGNLSCVCSLCAHGHTPLLYRWYHLNKSSDRWSLVLTDSSGSMWPERTGAYSCRAVWGNGRSLLSNSYTLKHSDNPTLTVIIVTSFLVVLGVLVVIAGAMRCHQQRKERAVIYEDMPLQSQGKQYEPLRRPHGCQADAEYESLQTAGLKKTEGGYEALKKKEGEHEIYHTLQAEGAEGGTKDYEALQRDDRKQEVYHTLHMQGAGSGAEQYKNISLS